MTVSAPTDSLLRQQFDLEWEKLAHRIDNDLIRRLGPIDWLINDMLDLLIEFHNQPASDLAPMIRRGLVEQDFVDQTGDSVVGQDTLDALDHQVDLVVDVLEKVRCQCLAAGKWSDLPMTPEMFG